ncbi:MAG: DUF5667 domain-containing protein [Rudaea sp.]
MSEGISPDVKALDDRADEAITRVLAGEPPPDDGYGQLAAELSRVMLEESPRLSPAVQARHLALLRARARPAKEAGPPSFRWPVGAFARLVQATAGAIVVVLIASGISTASGSSLPGSALYPIKRLSEQGSVLIAPSAGARARMWMNLASIRLDEAQRLASRQEPVDPALLNSIEESLLRALAETAGTQGSERVAMLDQITLLAMRQETVLDELAMRAGGNEREQFTETARALDGVAALASARQSDLPDSPVPTETNGADTLPARRTPQPAYTDEPLLKPATKPQATATETETETPQVTPTPTATSVTEKQESEPSDSEIHAPEKEETQPSPGTREPDSEGRPDN